MLADEFERDALSASEARAGWALVGVGTGLRIASFFFSDNAGGDAGAHVAVAAEWLQHPSLKLVFDTQPPGHFWLIGLTSLLVPDVVVAGRLLSLVCGIASLYVVWRLARFLYGASAGFFSLTAFALYSLHIGYSTTSSAEVPYLFFLLAATYFFLRGVSSKEGQMCHLTLSGICFSVAESVRYEAWIFLFGLTAAAAGVWFLRRSRPQASVFSLMVWALAAGAWPAFMMAYSWHAFGDPMHLVTLNRLRVAQSLVTVSFSHQLAVMPVALVASASIFVAIAAAIGIGLSFSTFPGSIFAAAMLFFAAVEVYEVLTGGLLATARYTITLGTLLCVLSGCGFEWIAQKWKPGRLNQGRAIVVVLLVSNCAAVLALSSMPGRFADEAASVSPRLRYQPHIASVARYLRSHMGSDDAVVFDDYNVESNILSDAAGLPAAPGRRAYLASRKNEITVLQYVETEHPRFLVYSDRGTLRQWLNLPPGCTGTQELGRTEFRCTFASAVYRVYELSYR